MTSTDELFDVAELFERQPLPAGRNVAIVSNSGGLGTLATDASRSRELLVPRLSATTRKRLRGVLPHATHVANPVDLTVGAEPGDFATAVRELLRETAIDAVVVLFIPLAENDPELVLDAVEQAADRAQKPVVAAILDADGQPPRRSAGRVPNFRLPQACAVALGRAADRRAWLSRPLGQPARLPGIEPQRARQLVAAALAGAGNGDGWIDPATLEALLDAYRIPLAPTTRCRDPDAAVAAAARFGGPIALKASLPGPSMRATSTPSCSASPARTRSAPAGRSCAAASAPPPTRGATRSSYSRCSTAAPTSSSARSPTPTSARCSASASAAGAPR